MSSAQSHEIQEVVDPDAVAEAVDDVENVSDGESGEDDAQPTASTSADASSSKKKKKKSKAKKALNALRGKKEVPDQVVDVVLEKVKERGGEAGASANAENVRLALEQIKIMDIMKGKVGLGHATKKDMADHKFWKTQPVTKFGEKPPEEDGAIEPSVPSEEVRQTPYPLPNDFEWATLDLEDDKENKEVYDLLSLNYVEDSDASFRFQYTAEFLRWACTPPGFHKSWHIGVRVKSNKKLVAFISAVPIKLRVREKEVQASEVNYLCVHKKLRSRRLAPVLIKEVTRKCNLLGTFQAIYTGGVVIPTPVSTCRYYHRSINIPKLVDIKFTYVPRNSTIARMTRLHKVSEKTSLVGLREMRDEDMEQVATLFSEYMNRFHLVPLMSLEEARHQFLSGRGVGEPVDGRRERQVTWSYVVEDPETHKITDFFSFYSLPSTVINNPKHDVLHAAYLFYYASSVGLDPDAEASGQLQSRLTALAGDALVIASNAKFDVFNALTLMDNPMFLEELKFGQGDGFLHFYLYNWRTAPLAGVEGIDGTPAGRGVGVVML
ncbi:acyl-CoA N-acyltransferase [Schizophyllum amplum]|uniref:Glycylpeptide N-tetradecanoyltransferase n=1 Tax=Schizophyllum amplum TaxID=97359 RepID=A0A550CD17_9AGAR|nr:acyl-CoA N-acyltransferase [Auriculariopsis ampla]